MAIGRARVATMAVLFTWTMGSAFAADVVRAPETLTIEGSGSLPRFKGDELARYLADKMMQAGISRWRFVAATSNETLPPNRVQWTFRPNPYAGGRTRYIGPIRSDGASLFDVHRLISAEARLYLDGRYQRLSFGQASVRGGPDDEGLAAMVSNLTNALLSDSDLDE